MPGTLVIQPLPGIGDMVWHLPHLEAIGRASPEGAVTVLTKRRSRADELFDGSAFVRRVLWLERAQAGEPSGRHDGALGAWRLAADLRAHAFEVVWILHDSPRYALAALLARIPVRIGFGTGRQRRFLNDRRILPRADRHLPTVEKATRLLGLHGLPVDLTPRFHPAPTATARVFAEHAARPRPWLGLGVGSSEPFKQWGAERFAALAASFAEATGGTVFAIAGPAERDAVAAVAAAGPDVVAAIGLPLGDAAALARACDAVAGNDTGLLNLAAATGVPTVGLFGGSPPLTQYPNLTALEPPGGAQYRVDRMAGIAVDTAAAAVLHVLDRRPVTVMRQPAPVSATIGASRAGSARRNSGPTLKNFTDARLERLIAYWLARRGDRGTPRRRDLDPLDIPDLLPVVTLVEVLHRPLQFRYRLVGTEVAEGFGRDATGRFVDADLYGTEAESIFATYERLVVEARPFRRRSRLAWNGRHWKVLDAVELPLFGDDGRVAMILGGNSFSSEADPTGPPRIYEPLEIDGA